MFVPDDRRLTVGTTGGGVPLLASRAGEHPQGHLAGYVGLMRAIAQSW